MAQADATYPIADGMFQKHSEGLTEGSGYAVGAKGSELSTGDLRRKYNFAERFSELAIESTPFFRLVSKIGKKPTDDPKFKYTEKRQSWMKRYAYVVGYQVNGGDDDFDDATIKSTEASGAATIAVGNTLKLWMATDYESAGNMQNISGQTSAPIAVGAAGTAPEFLLDKQIIQVNLSSTATGGSDAADYILLKIDVGGVGAETDVSQTGNTGGSGGGNVLAAGKACKLVTGKVIRAASGGLCSFLSDAPVTAVHSKVIHSELEAMRSYVVGNSYEEGSSLVNKTWKDNPYSTGYGNTQIFRSEFGMTNTARATVLKYEPNEWARVWKDKLIEHKWEIEQTGLFGSQYEDGSGVFHTQGAVDFILKYGNVFTWDSNKTLDDFLDDMSKYVDPRYNQSRATVYFCDTEVYNWLHKLGGFFKQNLDIGKENQAGAYGAGNPGVFGADLAITGRKKVLGLDMTSISTVYGDMNVTRCIALDRSPVRILGCNLNYVKYRPLVGNGMNRDTSIYVGVQSLENTGTDKRVDMILTEAGFEWSMPECHSVWK